MNPLTSASQSPESPVESPVPVSPDGASPTKPSQLREKLRKLELNRNAVAKPALEPTAEPCSESEAEPDVDKYVREFVARDSITDETNGNDIKSMSESVKSGRILIVDDEETNILTVQAYLRKEGYHDFSTTTESREAIALIKSSQPDVILLDIKMPHISGLDILRSISIEPSLKHIPSIVLTAASDPGIKQNALDLGANDFLTKPVDPHDLVPRVRNALIIKSHMDEMADQNAKLEVLVRRRTDDLFRSRQQLILSLARVAEHRDNETGNHVLRVGRYAGLIAAELGWSAERVHLLEQAAQLHDVGKIGVPDEILFKQGKLDPQEWSIMRKHCAYGKEIIEPLSSQEFAVLRTHTGLGADILHDRSSPMMMMATRIAQTHHERWDGTGYPLGLAGEDIPIEGRITAVADVFDAVSSERPYKKAFPREKCFEILKDGRGSHFDPAVLDAFFQRSVEIVQIQLELMDRQQH